MSLFIDLKYINLLSNRLPLFKKRNDFLFNFRCVLCGDSSNRKNKARGYFYKVPNKNDMYMKCHNCGASTLFSTFLKSQDLNLYNEYSLEKFMDKQPVKKKEPEPFSFVVDESRFAPKGLIDELLDRLDTLPEDNEAVVYCRKRKIPEKWFARLYYIDDVRKINNLTDKYKDKLTTNEPRLILPFYNRKGELEGLNCRALRNESLRYLSIKIKDDGLMLFGWDILDYSKKIYAVEGPIDSMFLDNSIAVGSTSFAKIKRAGIPMDNLVIILDNQPRNKDVVKIYQGYINNQHKILIWPDFDAKDINDLIVDGMSSAEIMKMIDMNTFEGLEAQLKFNQWKKVNI